MRVVGVGLYCRPSRRLVFGFGRGMVWLSGMSAPEDHEHCRCQQHARSNQEHQPDISRGFFCNEGDLSTGTLDQKIAAVHLRPLFDPGIVLLYPEGVSGGGVGLAEVYSAVRRAEYRIGDGDRIGEAAVGPPVGVGKAGFGGGDRDFGLWAEASIHQNLWCLAAVPGDAAYLFTAGQHTADPTAFQYPRAAPGNAAHLAGTGHITGVFAIGSVAKIHPSGDTARLRFPGGDGAAVAAVQHDQAQLHLGGKGAAIALLLPVGGGIGVQLVCQAAHNAACTAVTLHLAGIGGIDHAAVSLLLQSLFGLIPGDIRKDRIAPARVRGSGQRTHSADDPPQPVIDGAQIAGQGISCRADGDVQRVKAVQQPVQGVVQCVALLVHGAVQAGDRDHRLSGQARRDRPDAAHGASQRLRSGLQRCFQGGQVGGQRFASSGKCRL